VHRNVGYYHLLLAASFLNFFDFRSMRIIKSTIVADYLSFLLFNRLVLDARDFIRD